MASSRTSSPKAGATRPMRLLLITDLHGSRSALEKILAAARSPDAVLFGGDITNFGSADDAQRLIRLAEASMPTVWGIAGNCDSAAIEKRLVELGVSLFRRGVIRNGVGFHGLSAMPPWRSDMYQFTEVELAESLRIGYEQIALARRHVVLSHAPPRDGRLDRLLWGRHVGSTALRAFIEETGPSLVVCGHIHEGRGIESIGQTVVVNCGPAAAGSYALADVDEEVRVELHRAE